MNNSKFPLITILVCIPLLAALLLLDEAVLPLMTRLFMAEFGAVASGFAVYFSLKSLRENGFSALFVLVAVIGIVIALQFAVAGFALWPR